LQPREKQFNYEKFGAGYYVVAWATAFFRFNARHLKLDSQHLEHLKLTLKGPLQNHHITINAQHEQAGLILGAQGKLDTEQLIVGWPN
ncbi:MAG: hypothetical protein KZQ70_09700, partial [gamma proteobacterium symbiont of Lucinoma myriamae]|nr:hypothetical protein [gamma proteobacterium symbiont of Lucinoma myriamae]MCU7818258.1 hypothetical protein [gamma proteobacterium symbiont of Lucinoma myriamae]MCU7832771.1 hypothetical protein [gamma proteobacterium symbiont of Lucinoma myriamae]